MLVLNVMDIRDCFPNDDKGAALLLFGVDLKFTGSRGVTITLVS